MGLKSFLMMTQLSEGRLKCLNLGLKMEKLGELEARRDGKYET
jgi:hypothetical protein